MVTLWGAGGSLASAAGRGISARQNKFPTTAAEAIQFYESNVDDWLDGPTKYIIQNDERKVWKKLETTEQRQSFIDWFWARRDDDTRDNTNPYKEAFYQLVASANQRFHGFPKGWKSDRGRVWIILGRPDSISRRTSSQLFGRSGPDFEVWVYYTSGRNLGFRSSFGEYYVYFIQDRAGRLEIFDVQFGAGSYPPDLRRAFEYASEAAIVDPTLEFETETSDAGFVRSLTGSALPFEVPLEQWVAGDAAGVVGLPVRVALRSLLFQTQGDDFLAELRAEIELVPQGGGTPLRMTRRWNVRLSQEELNEHGQESLLIALSMPAPTDTYEARVVLSEPLADSTGLWKGSVDVKSGNGASAVSAIGSLSIPLDAADKSSVGLLGLVEPEMSAGEPFLVQAWVRGVVPALDQVRLVFTSDDGSERSLEVASSRWLGSSAGPLLIETRAPEGMPAGRYFLRLDLGPEVKVNIVGLRLSG
ncbi:MAG: GWxTD domain-containing protein [Acidobacteriota bacterium]